MEKMVAAVLLLMLATLVNNVCGQEVQFYDRSVETREGQQFTVRLQLLGPITEDVYVIVDVDSDVNGDFIGNTQVATFTPTSAFALVSFTVRDDDEPESKELFYLRIILIDNKVVLGNPTSIPVTIEASDDAYGVFGFVKPAEIVEEELFTSVVNLIVKRTVSFFNTVAVTYTVNSTSPEAELGVDISPVTGQVTFQPMQREAILQLQIRPDPEPENDETFIVKLTVATYNARINESEMLLTIRSNDAPVRFTQETYVFQEGPQTRSVAVEVQRGINTNGTAIGPLGVPVTVVYRFESGTAVSGQDFSSSDGELTFAAGETSKQIAFFINDDTAPEIAETFRIRLQSLNDTKRAVIASPYLTNIIISANDYPNGVITFQPTSETSNEIPVKAINEDIYSIAMFKVLRNQGTFGTVSVFWNVMRADGKAEPVEQDVGPQNGTLVFAAGENQKDIELTIVQDSLPEPSEQFDITLLTATGDAQIRGITKAKLTIEDSDNVYGRVEFGPDTSHGINTATTPRTFQLSVTRDGGRLENVIVNISVSYSDDGIEALPENIFEKSEVTATLPAGQDPTVVRINILSSAFLSIGGRFTAVIDDLRLDTTPAYGVFNSPTLGTRKQVVVSVSETEANGETGFNNTDPIIVEEPNTGSIQIPLLIIREGRSGSAVIRWSVSGVGQSADTVDAVDVAALSGTINIPSGSFSVELVITIQADDVPEIDEVMAVRLESIEPFSTQRLRPGANQVNITVLQNDNPQGVFQFSDSMNSSYSIKEGTQPITVVVERTGGDLVEGHVQFIVDPDDGRDFFGAPSALRFDTGVRIRTATILAKNEGEPELAESFTLRLLPLGNATLGDRTSIAITVLESDFPYGKVQFEIDPTIVFTSETVGGKSVNVTLGVERDRGTFGRVTVPWTLSPFSDADLRPSSGVIVFEPGESKYSLVLQVVNDNITESAETYAVQLGSPTGGAVPGIPMVATITITENDNPIIFTETVVSIDEPGNHTFTVQRTGNLNGAVSVACRTLDGSASALDKDYQEVFHQALTFASGEASKTVTVTVLDDDVPEGNETFTLELFDGSGDLLLTENSRATVVILANDNAYGVFSFAYTDDNSVEEGSTIFFDIVRAQGSFGAVEVSWEIQTLQNTALAAGSDFEAVRGTTTFQPQEGRLPLAITPLADNIPEPREVFQVVLTGVRVVTGLQGRGLARLGDSNLSRQVVVLASDDPNGRFAFPAASKDLSIAEDFNVGSEGSTRTTFTVERRQGTQGTVQVLWQIFSEPLGTNLPKLFDLLFTGQRPTTMSSVPSKQRPGTGTIVLNFSGALDSHVTVPDLASPKSADLSEGFSISAWVQPSPLCDGYIVARSSADGTSHYYSLRLTATAVSTTLDMTITSESSVVNSISPAVSGVVTQDGRWHHVLVAVGNSSVQFYLDGNLIRSSAVADGIPRSGTGVLLVGGRAPGSDHFVGYMQDVRIWAKTLTPSDVADLYATPALNDLTPASGVLTYSEGVRTQMFMVQSLQDIEEEGNEVFSVSLVATTGGAQLSLLDSRTTLTVLKSDNANGLFGFREACAPARIASESAVVRCNLVRQRGDDGTVTVTWSIQQMTAEGLVSAAADFMNTTGTVVFGPGERFKSFEAQVTEETVPELDESFAISLISALSDDGLVGSTNTSGASIDPATQRSEVTIVANDYPYGLLQFSDEVGMPPSVSPGELIGPTTEVPTVFVSEEGGIVPLVVERAQGLLGAVTVEWRTIDRTAVSAGKTPPDYVGAAGRLDLADGQNFGFINITVRDNSVPEGEKTFQVELVNPTGGAALGVASSVYVTVNASDNAYGVYQFADDSLAIMAQETGDVGYKSVFLKVVRLGGSIGADSVAWSATEDEDDGFDLVQSSGNISFTAGQTEANLELRVRGDTEPELDETVTVRLLQATQGTLGDTLKRSATVTIEANDDPYGYFVIISTQRPIRTEEAARSVSITIRRLYGKYGSVDIGYQTLTPQETYNYLPSPLSRADYQDFTPVSGNVSFLANQEFGFFSVPILDDLAPEQDETVFARLTSVRLVQAAQFRPVPNSPRLGLPSESYAQIIISSNDDASGVLELSPTVLNVSEGVRVPQISVVRSGGAFGEVTVQFQAVDGEAKDLQDYSLLSRQVVLGAGETSKLLPIVIVDDLIPELSESFTIQLLDQITGGATLGANRSAVITIEPSDDPNGVFEFVTTGQTVLEPENGQPYNFDITVFRTGGSIDVVTLQWAATLDGVPLTTDISPTSGSLFFLSNEASRAIRVSILPDDIPEGVENIQIRLLSATNGGRIGAKDTFQLTISPNDSPHGIVEFTSPGYTVQEGPAGSQMLNITRTGGTYGQLRVFYSTSMVDLVTEATYDGTTVLSYFAAPLSGQLSGGTAVNVSAADDELLACSTACLSTEACRSFQYGLLSGTPLCTWFTSVAVQSQLSPNANISYYVKDLEKVQPVLSRMARPGDDYISVTSGSFLIPDGNTTGSLPVTIVNDVIPELGEKFLVTLLRVAVDDPNAVTQDIPRVGAQSSATVTIETNDNANGAFRIYSDRPTADPVLKTVSVQEQDRLAVDLIVEREGGSIGEVTVTWQVSSVGLTATYGTDFVADGATLTFTPGQTRRIVTVTILDDNDPENDERFTVQLTNPGGGATLGSDDRITVIILANDYVSGVLIFNTTSVLAQEGDQFAVAVQRTLSTQGTVRVNWSIQGLNGLQPQLGFQTYSGSLTFLPGESEKVISLTVLVDDTPEVNEEYRLTLSNISTEGVGPTGAAVISPQLGTALITIAGSNNPHGVIQFATASMAVRVNEDAGSAALQLDRKFGAIGRVRVVYQVIQGTISTLSADLSLASPGQDFVSVTNGTVELADGQASGTISVTIMNDLLPEIDEAFLVMLTSVTLVGSTDEMSPPRLAANGTVAEVTIGANDGAQGVIEFASDSRSVAVDEVSPTLSLTVLRTQGQFGEVSVMFYSQSITGETVNGADYRLVPGKLVFAAGESQKTISIQIINDDIPEPAERFDVVLSNPDNGATLGTNIRASVTILANDLSAGQVYFASALSLELKEASGDNATGSTGEITVQRGPGIYGRVTVPFVVTTAFGISTTDVSPSSGVIVFEDRQSQAVVELTAVDDNEPELAETFVLRLQAPTGGAILGNITTATITVAASDAPNGLFEIYPANSRVSSLNVEENIGTVHLEVVRTQGLQGRVSLDVTTVSDTATFLSSSTNVILADFQTIPAAHVIGWHAISVGDVTYVLMLTTLNANVQLRDFLPESSPVEVGQCVLYRWQGALVYVKTLATDGATAAASFTAGGNTYFVIANSGKQGAREIQSIVYRLYQDGSVEVVQGLTTLGASDVKHYIHNDQHYLVFANSLDDSSRSDINSFIYLWDSTTQKFGSTPSRIVPTLYGKAVEVFVINQEVYMVFANYYDRASGSYEIDSIVYKKVADGSFVQHQRLATAGASDLAYVNISNVHYLIVGSNRQNTISSPQTSRVYRWDTATGLFVQHQDILTSRVEALRVLKMDDSRVLLAIANTVGASEVLQWDVSRSRFVPVWTGDPYLMLQPIRIPQPSTALYLMGAASVIAESDGMLFEVSHVSEESDFIPRRVTLTFEPTQTVLQTTVVILQDDVPEDTEEFSVSLVDPQNGAEIGSQSAVVINILSNDNAHGIIQFAADSLNVVAEEKDSADNTIQLNVVRQEGYFGRVAVQWVATGDHDGLNDITPLSGTVEFANGQTVATISLTIRDDSVAEFAEVTYVRLTQIVDDGTPLPSRGAQLGEATQAVITVLANDSPFGVVSWNTTSVITSEPEGTDRILILTIKREQGLQGQLRVSYVTSMALELPVAQQATSGEDFVSTQGSVTFLPGATTGSVQIVIKQDSIPEASEMFYVNLTAVELVGSGSQNGGQPSIKRPGDVMKVTILENDNAQGTVQFDVVTNNEGRVDTYEEYGRNNSITLQLRRTVGFFGSLTVTWQADPITANILDFTPSGGTAVFADGQQTAEIVITIIDDQLAEDMETFAVKLISISGDAVLGSVTSVTIAILKNDSPTGFFRFASRQVEVKESLSPSDTQGRAQLKVERIQGTQGLVNVKWRLSAEAQDDFLPPLEGTLSFIQGVVEQTLTLQSRPDGVLEGRETFTVSLISADNNADISPTEGDATVVILPDPGASGTISIIPNSRSVLIGEPGEYNPAYNGTANIVLSRAAGIFGEVVVTWALTPRDTAAFMQVEGSVTFLDLQQTATIVLQARDDSDPELRTTYTLQLSSASGGAVISPEAGAAQTEVLYVASDYPYGLFEFGTPETVSVSEDVPSMQTTVRRNKGLVGQVQVYYTTSPGTATAGQDFFPAAGVLLFQNGVDSQVVQVSLISDTTPEGPETFYINITSVTLLSPSGQDFTEVNGLQRDMPPAVGPMSVKTVIIEKNDNAEGIIEFNISATPFRVKEEAGIGQIQVIRQQGFYGAVSVFYQTQAISASSGIDYLPANGTLQFADGQTQALINVTLLDDIDPEYDEQFSITLSNPTGGVLLGQFRTAVVTIAKSDYPNGKFGFLGETQRRIPNPDSLVSLVFYIERTERLLGQQEVRWRIMGPNNPNLQLSDTSDISYTSGGIERTSGTLTWGDGEAGSKQFVLNVQPYNSWEIQKVFVIEIYDIQATPASVGNGEISPTAGKVVLTIEKFGDPNGIIEFSGAATSLRELEEPSGSQPVELGFPVVRKTGTGTTGIVQIYWEVHGAGSDVTDVRPRNGTLILEDGLRSGQISLQILPDDIPELTEEFTLELISVEGGAEINTKANTAIFRIKYNDNPHGLFGIRSDNQKVMVDPVDLSRSLLLNFTRYDGTFGSAILTYRVSYDEPLAGIVLASNTGTVTFNNGQTNVQTTVSIQSSGFLALGSTFSLSLVDVRFIGNGVTQPPELRAGETDAKIFVHAEAANSVVSFAADVIKVNDGENLNQLRLRAACGPCEQHGPRAALRLNSGNATLTITRQGTYGSIVVEWTAGELAGSLPAGVVNGQIAPASGSVTLPHTVESSNFTVQVNARIGQAETFLIRLPSVPQTPVSGGARLSSQNTVATLEPSGVLRFMPNSLQPEVSELDGQVILQVARVYGVQERIEFTYSTEDNTARANFDFRAVDRAVVIMDPYQATANISITVFEDDIPEQSEQFHVNLINVDRLPTPTQPVLSPRLDTLYTKTTVTIKESNDPYGVLWIQTDAVSVEEKFTTVTLIVRRTGGLFGSIGVRVRTVGGGEVWTSDIVPSTENTTANTIAQALGQRKSENIATGGLDYEVLDTPLTFQAGESQKTVTVVILDDNLPEPMETVLVYLTGVTGGPRIAAGERDGGLKGFAVIAIERSDTSNGLIGFAENSKNVIANEDANPVVRLTLTRLNAFFGDADVNWRAKLRRDSTEIEDSQLASQLESLTGVTTCPAGESVCFLDVRLIDDNKPEESFTFVVKLVSVEDDARLNEASLYATVTVQPSDDVRGLVQFNANSRVIIVSENTESVRLGVERVQGLEYDVSVGYRTQQMEMTVKSAGATIYPALDGEDFTGQQGTLVFRARSQELQYIDITLTPMMASSNPYPKQFYIMLQGATNGARINPEFERSVVRIVKEDEVSTWKAVMAFDDSNGTSVLTTLSRLDGQAQGPLSDTEVNIIDDTLKRIIEKGNTNQHSEEVQDATFDLFCKMLDPSKADATRGRHQLAESLERFAYTMLTNQPCPTPVPAAMKTKECAFVVVSAARWRAADALGFEYKALRNDVFHIPETVTLSTTADGTDDECVDFHMIEYNSRQWFPTQNGEQLLNDRVLSFGFKGRESGPISDPVNFRIHTPDRRIATKRAECVYFDPSSAQWRNPVGVCSVTNNLNMGTDDFVDCACKHMTSYGVIAKGYDPGVIGYTIWFYIACFICISCMFLVIVSHHLCYQRPTFASSLLMHMIFAIFAMQICLVVDTYLSPTEILVATPGHDNYRCIIMGLFLHYFFLAQFTWIVVQAINFWKILVMNDEHTQRNFIIFFLLGWGVPMVLVAIFYAVTFNVYKYETNLPVDFIYGDVNNNGEVCFITNAYAGVGGIILPVLLMLLVPGVVFVKAFQVLPQWQAYDDIYRNRYNFTEVRLLLFLWSLLILAWLWGGLHMVYGQLWMLVLFCICDILLGLLALVLYAILRNPCLMRCVPGSKTYYTSDHTDVGALPPPAPQYTEHHASTTSLNFKGSRTSLINDTWERGTLGGRSQMTVRRALPSQVYINPPIAIVSPAAASDLDPHDFDEILHALKTGQSYTPSEDMSRSIADDDSQLSTKLDRYETKRIDIADTHL